MSTSPWFVRKAGLRGVRYRATFTQPEAAMLRSVVGSVQSMLSRRLNDGGKDELAELTGMATGPAEAPDYAPLARLLPAFMSPAPVGEDGTGTDAAAHREATEQDNAAMRMLHEPSIVEAKMLAGEYVLRTVPTRGGTVALTEEQAQHWVAALNDVRISLGEILLRHAYPDMPATPRPGAYPGEVPVEQPSDDSPIFPAWQAYHWVTIVQHDLLEAMM